MEAYEQEDLMPEFSSNSTPPAAEPEQKLEPAIEPAQSTPIEPIVPADSYHQKFTPSFFIITIVVAIVAAGLSGALVYKLNSSKKSDCEIRYNNLTEEAKNKIATLKSSLTDYKKRAELCEQVNEDASANNGEI
ncbi:hypothetical protein KKC47_01945, partial [Patescibacteria group bacterium]|nr:hypothetical protein [Patescibacteria group bacterium]